MTLPNLPTDNLYKFIFLAGLTIVITSCILFVTQYNILSEKIDTNTIAVTEIETDLNFLEKDSKFIDKELLRLEKELKVDDSVDVVGNLESLRKELEADKNFREYYSFLLDHKEDLLPYRKNIARLRSMIDQNDSLNRKTVASTNILNAKVGLIKKDYRNLILLLIVCCSLIYIGSRMAFNGHKKWLLLVQKPTDEKIMLELKQLKNSFKNESD